MDENTPWYNFEALYIKTLANVRDIKYDGGRYVYVLSSNSVNRIDLYALPEPEYFDSYLIEAENYELSFDKTYTFAGSTATDFCIGYDKLFIKTSNNTYRVIDINTSASNLFSTPEEMSGNLFYYDNRLWFVGKEIYDEEHRLYFTELDANGHPQTWDHIIIPIRKQLTVGHNINTDLDGRIILTNFNNLSITKILTQGSVSYEGYIRLDDGSGANREPFLIYTSDDRDVYVSSINGMVSICNTTTNSVTHFTNSLDLAGGIVDDGQHVIFTTDDLIFNRKTTKRVLMTNGEEPDYSIETEKMPVGEFKRLVKTTAHTINTATGDRDIPEYIFSLKGDSVMAFINNKQFFRKFNKSIEGTAMVSFGKHDYTGD